MTIKFSGGVAASGPIKAEVNIAPIWVTSAGTVGSFEELTDPNFQFDATDPEGGSLIFTVVSGSVPAGLSLSSGGLLSGTASDVASDTTSGFTLRVTDEGGLFQDRTFSMEITDVVPIPNMWAWGRGFRGPLGLGDTTDRSSPVAIGSSQTWTQIALGQYTAFAIEGDGTLWSWGQNNYGQLGHGNVIYRSSPIQVGGLTDWTNAVIDSGRISSIAIKADNIIWTWGNNNSGQLGLGDTISRSSPVQVSSGGAVWSTASLNDQMIAIRTNGTLWSCGVGALGKLGLGVDINNRSTLTQVGNLTNWSNVSTGSSSSCAIKTDGTLWAWGGNNVGQLGLGDTINRSSPVQIGNLTNWVTIDSHLGSDVHAINSLGELWGWGFNDNGMIGDGTVIRRSSPVQVGLDTDWSVIIGTGVGRQRFAIKTDGTLWSWGRGNFGARGIGSTISASSPVQVGSLTDWSDIKVGGYHTLALRDTL